MNFRFIHFWCKVQVIYIDRLAPCTNFKRFVFSIVVYLKISCNFEPEFYDDKLVPTAAKTAKKQGRK